MQPLSFMSKTNGSGGGEELAAASFTDRERTSPTAKDLWDRPAKRREDIALSSRTGHDKANDI